MSDKKERKTADKLGFLPKEYTDLERCKQNQPAYCKVACPFGVDVIAMIEKVEAGLYNSAYNIYRDSVGFPELISNICHAPCEKVCPLREKNIAIRLRELEKGIVFNAKRKEPNAYRLKENDKRIAIIGMGLAGLGAILRLSARKYKIDVFEKKSETDYIWPYDTKHQLSKEEFNIYYASEIDTKDGEILGIDTDDYDAILITVGKKCKDIAKFPSHVFSILDAIDMGENAVDALVAGMDIAFAIDNYLKTGEAIFPNKVCETALQIDKRKLGDINFEDFTNIETQIAELNGFDAEAMVSEAKRCVRCRCDSCITYCDLLRYHKKQPLRLRDEAWATIIPASSEVKATPARRLINECTMCGACEFACPESIDLGAYLLAARRSMHRQDKLPWVFHDFFLRDMNHADSKEALVAISSNKWIFFPGCQLTAAQPDLVLDVYQAMGGRGEGGFLSACCGAIAHWSGEETAAGKKKEQLADQLAQLDPDGESVLICACPSCMKMLSVDFPDQKIISLYEFLVEKDLVSNQKSKRLAIFDPCASRENEGIKAAVRDLLTKLGVDMVDLALQSDVYQCCGYGGLSKIAKPEFFEYIANRRAGESEEDFVTYCIGCRDSFLDVGKPAVHILELLFDNDDDNHKQRPDINQRRQNREYLKGVLMGEKTDKLDYNFELSISDEKKGELAAQRILIEDVYEVVNHILASDSLTIEQNTGIKSGYHKLGYMTYWVDIIEKGKNPASGKTSYELVDAYSHRMSIELEAIWKGEVKYGK